MSRDAFPRAKVAEGVAVAVMLAAIMLRAIVSYEAFPRWSEDPAVVPAAITSLTPVGSLVVDGVMLLAAAAVLVFAGRDDRTTPLWMTVLASLGACGVMLHAYVLHATPSPFQLDHLTLGASWSAGIFTALAVRAAAMDPRWRALTAACLVGIIGPLAAKGVVQVFVEHPQTLAAFNANKSEMLAVRGWSEDSPMARAFIRRLSQPEASGWIGLSNVYSSFAAFACVSLVACTLVLARTRAFALAVVMLVVAGTALALSKSKGGIASAIVVGLPILTALLGFARSSASASRASTSLAHDESANRGVPSSRVLLHAAQALGIFCIAIPLGSVVIRGLVGERLSELSLFFRWFYMQGAARIFAEHLPFGVGPDGFQAAYLLAKPALSPEAVASPHSILLDWLSTLGLFGAAWCVLLVAWVFAVGRSVVATSAAPLCSDEARSSFGAAHGSGRTIPNDLRTNLRIVFLIFSIPTVLAAWIETPGTTISGTLARFIGLALAVCLAGVVMLALERDPRRTLWGIVAASLAVVAHAQIELTGVNAGSCAWFLAIVALAGSTPSRVPAASPRRMSLAGLAGSAAGIAVLLALPTVVRWERDLRIAASEVEVLAEANAMMKEASRDPRAGSTLMVEAIVKLFVAIGSRGGTEPRSKAEIDALFDRVLIDRLPRAEEHLAAAARVLPSHFATHQALSRTRAQFAEVLQRTGKREDAIALSTRAVTDMERHARDAATRASAWSWLATLNRTHAELLRDDALLAHACEAWEKGAALDPYSITYPTELARTFAKLALPDDARRWARKALENNANLRLDPLQGLSDRARREMERIAR